VKKNLFPTPAAEVLEALKKRGASFFAELARSTGRLPSEVEDALWELVTRRAGNRRGFGKPAVACGSQTPSREGQGRSARPRHAAGRWACCGRSPPAGGFERGFCEQLLLRWGVVFSRTAGARSSGPVCAICGDPAALEARARITRRAAEIQFARRCMIGTVSRSGDARAVQLDGVRLASCSPS